jgi:hypothetical protein
MTKILLKSLLTPIELKGLSISHSIEDDDGRQLFFTEAIMRKMVLVDKIEDLLVGDGQIIDKSVVESTINIAEVIVKRVTDRTNDAVGLLAREHIVDRNSAPEISWPFWLVKADQCETFLADLDDLWLDFLARCGGNAKKAARIYKWQATGFVIRHWWSSIRGGVLAVLSYFGFPKIISIFRGLMG